VVANLDHGPGLIPDARGTCVQITFVMRVERYRPCSRCSANPEHSECRVSNRLHNRPHDSVLVRSVESQTITMQTTQAA
jgi:hypothetical protein